MSEFSNAVIRQIELCAQELLERSTELQHGNQTLYQFLTSPKVNAEGTTTFDVIKPIQDEFIAIRMKYPFIPLGYENFICQELLNIANKAYPKE